MPLWPGKRRSDSAATIVSDGPFTGDVAAHHKGPAIYVN